MADFLTVRGETASRMRTRRLLAMFESRALVRATSENSRPIGDGAFESRVDFGSGYRIYFGMDGDEVILLCGGDKSTQDADITRAKEHWKDYKRRNRAWKGQRR